MSSEEIATARQAVTTAMAALRDTLDTHRGQDLIDQLRFLKTVLREAEHDLVHTNARLEREGEFAERGVTTPDAIADLLRCAPRQARALARTADGLFPTTLLGETLPPRFPATAAALAEFTIDTAHAEVITRALATDAARRITPDRLAALEHQLADLARTHRPDQLARMAGELVDALDQDGPEPGDNDGAHHINELFLTHFPDGIGGRVKGRLDAATFDVLTRALRALITPATDESTSLGQRQADALGELCEHALDTGHLPVEGGQRPHVTMVLDYEQLTKQAREVILDYGGRMSAADVRALLCDAQVTPVVLSGSSEPLDVGRQLRTATVHQRRAVAARDRGCAHPGCARPASWCGVSFVTSYA